MVTSFIVPRQRWSTPNRLSKLGRRTSSRLNRRTPAHVHGRPTCTLTRDLHETSTRYYLTNMDAIEAALKDLKLQDGENISTIAKLHGVNRSTLSRR